LHNPGAEPRIVFAHTLRDPGKAWLQLRCGTATYLPEGSWLRITARADGAVQRHDAESLADYQQWSAAFNGDEVLLELIAGAGTRANHVVVEELVLGIHVPVAESICGPNDNRTQSSDLRQGRLWIGCTGWLIGQAGPSDLMLSAGHCVPSGPYVLELNVPNSTAGGSVVRSHPNDQYPFAVFRALDSGIGSDWSLSLAGRNSNTGLLPTEANGGQFYELGTVPTGTGNQNM